MAVALIIVTPSGEAFRGDVDTVLLPGSEGDFGVLENHERFLTPLRIGGIEIVRSGETLFAAIGEGFAEVGAEGVTVLVDSCDLADEMDVAEEELSRERAEQGLAQLGVDEGAERRAQYERAIELARHRVEVAKKAQGG
jgi:F-type H+-transporting ATPase subunit epsilon